MRCYYAILTLGTYWCLLCAFPLFLFPAPHDSRDYVLLEPVAFGSRDQPPTVSVEAVPLGCEHHTTPQRDFISSPKSPVLRSWPVPVDEVPTALLSKRAKIKCSLAGNSYPHVPLWGRATLSRRRSSAGQPSPLDPFANVCNPRYGRLYDIMQNLRILIF